MGITVLGGMEEMARVWVVEDDPVCLELVRFILDRDGHDIVEFTDAASVLEAVKVESPDLFLLDINLPDLSGFEVCRALREAVSSRDVPILVASTRRETADRLRMLEIGADDFLTKPFDSLELSLRIRNRLRRSTRQGNQPSLLSCGDLQFDPGNREVRIGSACVALTPSEAAILRYLLERSGRAVDSETLLVEALGYPPALGSPDILRTHIRNLRQKIERDPAQPSRLLNRPRLGYLLVASRSLP